MFYQRMGNPTTPEGKALLVERSPLTSAGKIKTPLMIAQGANDPRVNHAESEQIVVALRDRGFPVEYLLIRMKATALPDRSTTWPASWPPNSSLPNTWAVARRKAELRKLLRA